MTGCKFTEFRGEKILAAATEAALDTACLVFQGLLGLPGSL